jgi:hypothetical protein
VMDLICAKVTEKREKEAIPSQCSSVWLDLCEFDSLVDSKVLIRQAVVHRLCCNYVRNRAFAVSMVVQKANLVGDDHDSILFRVAPTRESI